MAKKELLFTLIKSLSKAEKRYFRLYCKQSGTALNYLKLFNAIEVQDDYDEQAIKKRFKKETFTKQLHVTKNYLRQLILKSLRSFHGKISKDAELKDALRNVEILYHKELYALCLEELKRAETIAGSFELNSGLFEVFGWKRKLEQTTHVPNYARFTELLRKQQKVIDALYNTNQHWQHAVQTSATTMSNAVSGQMLAGVSHVSLENAQTLEAKVLFYNTSYLTYLRNGIHDKAENALTDLLNLLKTFPHRINEDPALYISSANNLVSYFVFSKQYDKAITLINQSRDLYDQAMGQHEKKSLLKQILRIYNLELEIYRDNKTFEKNLPFIQSVESFISRHVAKIPTDYLYSFWFQLANIHFMRKDFDRSSMWLNQILNSRYQQVRTDLQIQARFLNLMIHLEQDNLFVLRYFIDSTRRFLKKVNQMQPFENLLLTFFSKIGQTPKFEYKARFREFHRQLFSGEAAQLTDPLPDYIDYKSWIEGKL